MLFKVKNVYYSLPLEMRGALEVLSFFFVLAPAIKLVIVWYRFIFGF